MEKNRQPCWCCWRSAAAGIFVLLLQWTCGVASAQSVGVLFPDASPPYRAVFEQILAGVVAGPGRKFEVFSLRDGGAPPPDLVRWSAAVGSGGATLICLGEAAVMAAASLRKPPRIIASAVLDLPEAAAGGIRLIPDPAVSFAYLQRIAPLVRRVHLVATANSRPQQIERAHETARALNLELKVRYGDDLRGAARHFGELLPTLGSSDAVWIRADRGAVDDATTLPLVLRTAWDNNVVVFSDSLAHVNRGALFALFPDNEKLGRSLAALALEPTEASSQRSRFLTDTRLAVNIRTARHLGLAISPQLADEISIQFPQR